MIHPEFKEEAVRQIVEWGYSVAGVSARIGVATHSFYKWIRAVTPNKSEKQAAELVESRARFCVFAPSCVALKRSARS